MVFQEACDSLEVAGVRRHPGDQRSTGQDLYATLTDTGSQSRKIRVSKFAEIPEPHKRNRNQYTKSAMRTVRIPLHAYTIAVAGKQDVDLANIDHVRFDFGVKATGEIEIDSVEFTH